MNEGEKLIVFRMIRIYCRSRHKQKQGLCRECQELHIYAQKRLEHCPYKEEKPVCKRCPIHCYKPEYKEKIREVMRFAGPRMLWHHPLSAIRYMRKSRRSPIE